MPWYTTKEGRRRYRFPVKKSMRYAHFCPLCDKPYIYFDVPIERIRHPVLRDGSIDHNAVEFQCPNCNQWITHKDELDRKGVTAS
jgi:hypothetical protein